MEYYKKIRDEYKQEDFAYKYEVKCDHKKLEEVYHEIREKCGVRTIVKNKDSVNPNAEEIEIELPPLAELIGMFMGATTNMKDIPKILEYLFGNAEFYDNGTAKLEGLKQEKATLVEEIRELIGLEYSVDVDLLQKLIDRYKIVQRTLELNKDVDPSLQYKYIEVLKQIITLQEVGKIEYATYVKVMHFNNEKPIC